MMNGTEERLSEIQKATFAAVDYTFHLAMNEDFVQHLLENIAGDLDSDVINFKLLFTTNKQLNSLPLLK